MYGSKSHKLIPFSIINDCISALYRHEQQFSNVAIRLWLEILKDRETIFRFITLRWAHSEMLAKWQRGESEMP